MCSLSNFFALYIAELGRVLEKSGLGIKMGEINIPALLFADDIVLIGKDEHELAKLLEIIGIFGVERKLEFNPNKSKVMVNWREVSSRNEWLIGGQTIGEGTSHKIKITECEEYKYLGIIISIRGNTLKRHEEYQINNTKKKMGRIKGYSIGSGNKSFCAKVAWDKVVLPATTFGMEAVKTSKSWEKRLESMELEMGRFITGASITCAKSAIIGEIGWQSVKSRLAQMKLTYARRFEWEKDCWGKSVWEIAKKSNSNWWKQIIELAAYFDIDMNKECGNLKNWKKYIKENLSRKEIKNWRQDIRKSTTTRSMIGKRKPKWENYITGNEAAVALFKLRAGE